jgi:hypothetical protein
MKSRAEVLLSVQAKIRLLHLAYSTEQAIGQKPGLFAQKVTKVTKVRAEPNPSLSSLPPVQTP